MNLENKMVIIRPLNKIVIDNISPDIITTYLPHNIVNKYI